MFIRDNDFYSLVYNVIKLEFICNDKSEVLTYVLDDETCILEINNLIKEEVESLTNSINNIEFLDKLKLILNKKDTNGISEHYVSEDIFRCLVMCSDPDKVKETMISKLNSLNEKLDENINNLKSEIEKCETIFKGIRNFNDDIEEYKKDFYKRLVTLVLSGGLYLGVYVGLGNLYKHFGTKYYTTVTTYSSEELVPSVQNDYMKKIKNGFNVTLEINDKIDSTRFGPKQLVDYTYDVTDYVDEDFDYNNLLDVDKLGVEYSNRNVKENLGWVNGNVEDKSTFKYIVTSQDLSENGLDKESYDKIMFCTVLALFISYLVGNIGEVYYIFGDVKSSIKRKKDIKSHMLELKISFDKLYKLFDSNEEVRREFMSILDSKKELLEESSEILKINFDNLYSEDNTLRLKFKEIKDNLENK